MEIFLEPFLFKDQRYLLESAKRVTFPYPHPRYVCRAVEGAKKGLPKNWITFVRGEMGGECVGIG